MFGWAIVLVIVGLVLACLCVYLMYRSEGWIHAGGWSCPPIEAFWLTFLLPGSITCLGCGIYLMVS